MNDDNKIGQRLAYAVLVLQLIDHLLSIVEKLLE